MFKKLRKNEVVVKLNELPANTDLNKFELVEVKDEKIISRVINAVPEAAKLIINADVALQGVKLANARIYQAILPAGAKLADSKEVNGAVRGFFRSGKGINGHANFMPVDGAVEKINAVNIANAAMGASSLIVGQYYMNQINSELVTVNENVSKISDFQNDEYKSKVLTLLTQIYRASVFKTEILEDNELRKEELSRLQSMETTCMELLTHANIAIDRLSNSEGADFNKYYKMVDEVANWQKYQEILNTILYMISELNYVLHLGAMSKEQSYSVYTSLFEQTDRMMEKIKKWHIYHEEKFGLDIDQAIIERRGIDAIIHKPLGLIKEDFKYRTLKKQEVVNIRIQKGKQITNMRLDNRDLYNEDVNIIINNGKLYYLPVQLENAN